MGRCFDLPEFETTRCSDLEFEIPSLLPSLLAGDRTQAPGSLDMSTTMTTTLGTSNVRGSSRQTRTNPTRVSKTIGATLRQNSLISNPPAPGQGAAEPPAFYPAITYFADAIAALPRDYRRHTSLLKEVDAKAWSSEESLQTLLTQCLIETNTPRNVDATGHGAAATATVAMDDGVDVSAANSVAGAPADTASQSSNRSADPAMVQRRQLFATLRHNLMQMMVTMEEKNHVINNANEELSRGMRRLDSVWPHIAGEISEEARLGSLKHWAYTETNPVKKPTAPTTRREATSTTAVLHENEVAHRSESRREAVLAKKHRSTQNVDSDFDDLRTAAARKAAANGKKRGAEAAADPAGLGISGVGSGKRKKIEKAGPAAATVGMERSLSAALAASSRMSREPSQQDNGSKKRKAPNASSTVARKRCVKISAPNRNRMRLIVATGSTAIHKTLLNLRRRRSPAILARKRTNEALHCRRYDRWRDERARTRLKPSTAAVADHHPRRPIETAPVMEGRATRQSSTPLSP